MLVPRGGQYHILPRRYQHVAKIMTGDDGGFFDGLNQYYPQPVGGNGKSALLELLRLAFDDPRMVDNALRFFSGSSQSSEDGDKDGDGEGNGNGGDKKGRWFPLFPTARILYHPEGGTIGEDRYDDWSPRLHQYVRNHVAEDEPVEDDQIREFPVRFSTNPKTVDPLNYVEPHDPELHRSLEVWKDQFRALLANRYRAKGS